MAVKKTRKPKAKRAPIRRITKSQSNIGKGPNININIDQSKRTKKSGAAPQRQPQIISTYTPVQAPAPIYNFPLPTNLNPFESVVRETQKASIKPESNELEKPKEKENEAKVKNNEVFEMATQTNPIPEITSENVVVENKPTKGKINLGGKSNVMTFSEFSKENKKAEIPYESFKSEGQQLSDVHLKLTPKQLRNYRKGFYEEELKKTQIQRPPEEQVIQAPPENQEIAEYLQPDRNDFERYKQLTGDYKKAEENTPSTPLKEEKERKEKSEVEIKSEYEKYIDSIYKDKEKLRQEAEEKGINVQGKSRKQVRDILLGKQEDFKLAPLPLEKKIANIEEEKQKRIAIIEGMSWQKLQSEAKRRGVAFKKGIKQQELRQLLIDNIVLN